MKSTKEVRIITIVGREVNPMGLCKNNILYIGGSEELVTLVDSVGIDTIGRLVPKKDSRPVIIKHQRNFLDYSILGDGSVAWGSSCVIVLEGDLNYSPLNKQLLEMKL